MKEKEEREINNVKSSPHMLAILFSRSTSERIHRDPWFHQSSFKCGLSFTLTFSPFSYTKHLSNSLETPLIPSGAKYNDTFDSKNNYSIFLPFVTSNSFETVISDQLDFFSEHERVLLSKRQYGFRSRFCY